MALRRIAALMLIALLVPTVQAGPAERACHAVVDNPWAPLLANCGPVGEHETGAYETFERVCEHANSQVGAEASCWYYRMTVEDPVGAWNIQCRWLNANPEEAVPEVDCYV